MLDIKPSQIVRVRCSGFETYHRVISADGDVLIVQTILKSTGKKHPQAPEKETMIFISDDGKGTKMEIIEARQA